MFLSLQRVATEAIVAAASKKDKAKSIINDGINILKVRNFRQNSCTQMHNKPICTRIILLILQCKTLNSKQ